MSLFEKKYSVTGWRGDKYSLTEKELYERVLDDSKSDYNWIASATELVRVCNEPGFSQGYAIPIKIAILNCFANLEFKKEIPSHEEPTDKDAVYYCYNSLSSPYAEEMKEIVKAKTTYLYAVIKSITRYHFHILSVHRHAGPTYPKICEEWIMKKIDENISKSEIDFKQLLAELEDDFDRTIKSAEEEGTFEKDDAEYREKLREYWASIDFKNI